MICTLILAAFLTAHPDHAKESLNAQLGWTPLMDTKSWHGFKQADFPKQGWAFKDGVLSHTAGGGGGDLVSAASYGDFELSLDFKSAPKANSGIMYRVQEKYDATWQTGPEYQILEDTTYGVKLDDPHSSGALYDLVPPAAGKVLHGAGEWNHARIYLRNGLLQHWLNDQKVVETVVSDRDGKPTADWLAKIAASKFKPYEGFGVTTPGHLAIQDHGDEVAFKNVQVRALDAHPAQEINLYNGKDLKGWKAIVPDAAKAGIKPEDVWSIKDGILICKGNPVGYIRTEESYKNFILRVEWRFNPVTKQAGNSGVLLRMVGDDKVWPKSIEAQLESGNAGDFWNIDNVVMTVDPARTKGRNTKKTHGAERPIGEWNEYEIIVHEGDIVLFVNGEELNHATNVEVVPGKICLQSEGAEIQFRSVRLTPLE